MTKILELYGISTRTDADWSSVISSEQCPFLARKCQKARKSEPQRTIGTCTIAVGRANAETMICPFRLLERNQIFLDCLHLLTLHQPGNELHVVPEMNVPGGSVDYCLVSVRSGKPIDFVGIELQTLDTTGTVWPERQRFAHKFGIKVKASDRQSTKPFGLNWKMTAKTILVQLHHKVQTFEHLGKHLVLVAQDHLISYMNRAFSFDHLEVARLGDPMHFHPYALLDDGKRNLRLQLGSRLSTNSVGIAKCLGLQGEANVELEDVLRQIESKMSSRTILAVEQPPPTAGLVDQAMDDGDR